MSIIIQTNKEPIKNFTIFAERHSGTNFLEKWIKNSFDIPIVWKYGWKHFWTHHTKTIPDSQNTLFIGIVRNPYDWMSAMYKNPYHISFNKDTTFLKFLNHKIVSTGPHDTLLEEYDNIFNLRETKNQHLLNITPNICENYLLLNYESLLNIDIIFNEIASNFKLPKYKFLSNNFIPSQYNLDLLELNTINHKLNWQTENYIGYNKRTYL